MLRSSSRPRRRSRSASRSPTVSSRRKPAGVDHGHHRVEPGVVGQAAAVLELPLEGRRHRHRLGDAGGLDQDRVEPPVRGQLGDAGQQILAQRAADAAVGQLDQPLLGAVEPSLAGDQRGVDVDLAHVVDDHRDPPALPVGEHVVEQRGLARAEKAGQHGDRNRPADRHWLTPLSSLGAFGNGTVVTTFPAAMSIAWICFFARVGDVRRAAGRRAPGGAAATPAVPATRRAPGWSG